MQHSQQYYPFFYEYMNEWNDNMYQTYPFYRESEDVLSGDVGSYNQESFSDSGDLFEDSSFQYIKQLTKVNLSCSQINLLTTENTRKRIEDWIQSVDENCLYPMNLI